MIDHETLIWTLLTRDLPSGTFVSLEENISGAQSITLPAVIYSLVNTGQTQNGPNLWTGQLDTQVLGSADTAWGLASDLYDSIHAWAEQQTGIVADIGWVSTLSDIEAFTRSATTQTVAKGVIQYAGSFALALRNQ